MGEDRVVDADEVRDLLESLMNEQRLAFTGIREVRVDDEDAYDALAVKEPGTFYRWPL